MHVIINIIIIANVIVRSHVGSSFSVGLGFRAKAEAQGARREEVVVIGHGAASFACVAILLGNVPAGGVLL